METNLIIALVMFAVVCGVELITASLAEVANELLGDLISFAKVQFKYQDEEAFRCGRASVARVKPFRSANPS